MVARYKVKSLSLSSDFSSHLSQKDFSVMIALAVALHLFIAAMLHFLPQSDVIDIPVRTLNIKLGGVGGGSSLSIPAFGTAEGKLGQFGMLSPSSGQMQKPIDAPEHISENSPAMKLLEQGLIPEPNLPQAKTPKPKSQQTPIRQQVISEETVQQAEQSPSRFTRNIASGNAGGYGVPGGVIGGSGVEEGSSGEGGQTEVMRRYEQVISLWIDRHKIYPMEAKMQGMEGSSVIRVRIDRQGNIVFFRLEKPTRFELINNAVIEMVRASNPVPPVPFNYPAGNLFEFLIPISFKLE